MWFTENRMTGVPPAGRWLTHDPQERTKFPLSWGHEGIYKMIRDIREYREGWGIGRLKTMLEEELQGDKETNQNEILSDH